jgi:hypothetical protein
MPLSNHDPEANETRFSEMLSSVEDGRKRVKILLVDSEFGNCECATNFVDLDEVGGKMWRREVPTSGNALCMHHKMGMKKDHIYCFVAI